MRDRWERWDRVAFAAGPLMLASGVLALFGSCPAVGVVAMMFGLSTVLGRFNLRLAYNRAWLAGRTAMVSSLVEANQRGMSEREWLLAEADRDGFGAYVRQRLDETDRRGDDFE